MLRTLQGSLPEVSIDAESARGRKRTCVAPRWRVSRTCEAEVEGRRLGTLSWRVFDAGWYMDLDEGNVAGKHGGGCRGYRWCAW